MATNSFGFDQWVGDTVTATGTTSTGLWQGDQWPAEEPTLELAQGELFDPMECINPWQTVTITNTDTQVGDITWTAPNTAGQFQVNGNSFVGTTTTGSTLADNSTVTINWSDMQNGLTWGDTG